MKRTNTFKRIFSVLLLLCTLLSSVEFTAFAASFVRDGEVVKQGTLVASEDGMPTYSYRLTGTADWSGCTCSSRRHNWNQSKGTISNLIAKFDRNTIVGSGSAYEYNQDSHYASLQVTCEHDRSTTLNRAIYTNNGEPAIAQAQMAKDVGIEIYTVFLDGYDTNELSSKKNAEDTMKSVATNEDHYMATQDMSELSSLFQSIGSSLVTPTNAATNRPELVDNAVKRRFSIRYEVQVFSPDELLHMSEQFLTDVKSHADFRVEYDREDLVRFCASGVKQSEVIDILTESLAEAIEKDSVMVFPQ